jgi:alginate O-acetyltransferase complex protein AlgI
MVFSDPLFIFAFFPIALALFHLSRLYASGRVALTVLIGISFLFYAYWSVIFLGLLVGQIMVNYIFAKTLARNPEQRGILVAAVVLNLLLLGYFKYRNFFLENVEAILPVHFHLLPLVVPLAISFHTFQQIALLADIRDGEADVPPPLEYVFFVVFFPQLIAGPIVLHREMGKQIKALLDRKSPGFAFFGPGLFLFLFGLTKKIVIADQIGFYADWAFRAKSLQMPEAWAGAIDYALQLYFDFSGYSDMAVGLGLMFGFRLPYNFLIPFAAPSMIEYWKRWHITMTRFFTMYLYAPLSLAGLRWTVARGYTGPAAELAAATAIPVTVTFLASGLWHGAGWQFIAFGFVNAIGLTINHIWHKAKVITLPPVLGWLLTMITILVSLVYFRAHSLSRANAFLSAMFIPGKLEVPEWWRHFFPNSTLPTAAYEMFLTSGTTMRNLAWIAVLVPLSMLLPPLSASPERIKPSPRLAVALASMIWLVAGLLDQPRTFLYFAF